MARNAVPWTRRSLLSSPLRRGLSIVLLAGLSLIAALSAVAARPDPASACSGASRPPAPARSQRSTGATPLVATAVKPLAGGGAAYQYSVDGATVTLPVPPAGFDPLHASAAQLAEYGFQPQPPSNSPAYASWFATMSSYRSTPAPNIAVDNSPPNPLQSQSGSAASSSGATYFNGAWAGWVASASSNHYVATQMDLTEPSVTTVCPGTNGAAQWIGLGGYVGSSTLSQTGVEVPTGATDLCSSKSSGYCAWYEYFNASKNVGPKIISSATINAGDNMHFYMAYSTSNGEINFYVADNTTGTGQPVLITGVGSSYYDGTSADFIGAERPNIAGVGLKHFSTVHTSNSMAETTSGSWQPISSAPNPVKQILVYNGDTLATAGNLDSSGEGFSVTWDRCN